MNGAGGMNFMTGKKVTLDGVIILKLHPDI
jgi:hypothetical protein